MTVSERENGSALSNFVKEIRSEMAVRVNRLMKNLPFKEILDYLVERLALTF